MSEIEALQAQVTALEKYIRRLDGYVEHRESCRSNGISGREWSISSGGKCNCGLAKVLESEPRAAAK